ncbi:MAG: class I SAM-dependent methyltransferase [Thermomicrobiales bacterium]|nr:MAG: class I SAM-dependent methyltransferase [Thermomicrobiales bacterium]
MTDRSIQAGSVARSARPSFLARAAWRVGHAGLERLRVGAITVILPNGTSRLYGDPSSAHQGEIRIHEHAAFERFLIGGETGGGEAYMEGLWSSPDLAALIRVAAYNRASLALYTGWWRIPAQLGRTLAHRSRRNTRDNARRNIAAHYDLGNEFYRLFLDESMTYSSAVFESEDQSLEAAQQHKYQRMAERAGLQAGMHVLEIGTGWGGFAIHAAGQLGCRVTTVTISKEQHALARQRVAEAGLADLVDVQLRDYRDIDGVFDAVVSIEMLEAVGHDFYGSYFEAVDRALVPGGKASIQVITFPDVAYDAQRRGANWIQTYIFPGGLCPSLAVIEQNLHGTRLLLRDATDIAPSYVRTLREWRVRFMANLDAVRAQGFDERFIRMWEYYLALSEAGFATGLSQDHQIVLEKRRAVA